MSSDTVYSRIIDYNEEKDIQVRVSINIFREIEYLHIREYYRDFEGDWAPSNKGIVIPLTMENSKELFSALVEILSLAESKEIIVENFKELIESTYQ